MDEDHLAASVRYVAMNPVRAGLTARAIDWTWSSAATLLGLDDDVTEATPVRSRLSDLAALLDSAEECERTMRLRRAESIGRPVGDAGWLESLEQSSGRCLQPARRGRKPKEIISALSP